MSRTKTGKEQVQKSTEQSGEKKYTDSEVNALINRKFAGLKKQLDDLTRQNTIYEITKMARGMLSEADIFVSDELLTIIVTEDAEKTKAAVDSFSTLFTAAVEKAAEEWFVRRSLVNEIKR